MALKDNLISVWELDEASGNAVDAHGSNTLTENNGVPATTGKINGARDFDGSNDYFSLADNASLSTGDIDFSLTAWLKFDSHTSAAYIVNKWNTSSNREYAIQYSTASNRIRFDVSNNGTTIVQRAWSSDVTDGVWYFVACGHNATTNEIWLSIDSATPLTTAHSTGVLDGNSAFRIGNRHNNADYFDGVVDQVAFWKRDIRSDLAALYNSGAGVSYATIIGGGGIKRLIGGGLVGTSRLIGGSLVR